MVLSIAGCSADSLLGHRIDDHDWNRAEHNTRGRARDTAHWRAPRPTSDETSDTPVCICIGYANNAR